MKIIAQHRTKEGMVVLRESKPGEWVTGFIKWEEGGEPITDSTQHLYGHYFQNKEKAIEDFKDRKERGF